MKLPAKAARLAAARRIRHERRAREFTGALRTVGLGGILEGRVETERRLWLKLAANAVINPLSAMWNVRNGLVLERIEGRHLAREVVAEIASVALALAARGDACAAPSAEELYTFVAQTAAQTELNYSSMQQDIARGRMTEIDALNGW